MKNYNMDLSVDSVETFSTLDGPGIRYVVFLNGCTLRCKFCHNPETWHIKEFNESVENLHKKILKYVPYFNSNGGVTLSGGEPLLQSNKLIELCKLLKEDNIHIALDTAGIGEYKEILNYIDLVIFDIKDITEKRYKELTTGDINKSLEFIKYITEINKPVLIRQVIVPTLHDNIEFITNLSNYIKTNFKKENIVGIEFLPFHQRAKEKYHKLNIEYPYENLIEMDIDKCNQLYNQFIEIFNNER